MASRGFLVDDNFLFELDQSQLHETRVKSGFVVLASEMFDRDLRIDSVPEPLNR